MDIKCYIPALRARLQACPATNLQLAGASHGVLSPSWISKFRSGRMLNPRVDTLSALMEALEHVELESSSAEPIENRRAAA
jgi:hypothetical protein